MNINGAFPSSYDVDHDVPDLNLDGIPLLSRMTSTTTNKELQLPWNMNMNLQTLAAADHFTLLQTAANQLFSDNTASLQSLGTTLRPHLRGPVTPIVILASFILLSFIVSLIVSILQLAALSAAVVYFFPSVLAAIPSTISPLASSSSQARSKPASRVPVAAFASVLAASYAFSSLATIVVLASSAYAVLNQAAVASAKSKSTRSLFSQPDTLNARRDKPWERRRSSSSSSSSGSMFQRLSRRRDSNA
ncbi:hypothetical protein SEPCBS119000_006554 [Sporothrix epigloea]|uniref:Uncharacterized protein n=1 Tax=Sporothrix epigloea TaxID=1892477 RepID=A0ABP0E6U7_9PEZI